MKRYIFVLLLAIYIFSAPGKPWIEASYQFAMSREFVRTLSLSTPEYTLGPNSAYARIQGPNGRWYDYHGQANIIAMAPVAILDRILHGRINEKRADDLLNFLSSLTGAALSAWMCVVFFELLRLFGKPVKTALGCTLALALFSIVFPYAVTNYEANLDMLAVVCGLYYLFRFEQSSAHSDLALSAFWAGVSLNTRDFGLIFVGSVSLYVGWLCVHRRKALPALVFGIAFLPLLVFWLWANYLRTGNFLLTPIALGIIQQKFLGASPSGNIVQGLLGILFSPGGSIFVYSPILLLALFGYRRFCTAQKAQACLVFGFSSLWLLALSKVPDWMGFYCWGPRYMLETIPLMMIPLAWCGFWEAGRGKLMPPLACVVGAWSFIVQISGVFTSWFARMTGVLSSGRPRVIYTVEASQWWDSVKLLAINSWNLLLGKWLPLKTPDFDAALSPSSAYTARTFEPWWNRLLFEHVNPIVILLITCGLIAVIVWCAWRLRARVGKPLEMAVEAEPA